MSKTIAPLPITLDKKRTLFCDFNALAEFQHFVAGQTGAFHQVRSLLAALLLHEDPDMTPARAGQLIPFEQFAKIRDACQGLLEQAQEAMGLLDKGSDGQDPSLESPQE